jgi:hypothetical protein
VRNLKSLLQREPAALGSVVASLIPVLVLIGLVPMNEQQMAAVVVAVNTTVGFVIRLTVAAPVPARPRRRRRPALATGGLAAQPQRGAGER